MRLKASLIEAQGDIRLPLAKSLYENAFPIGERKPISFLDDVVVRQDYALIAVSDENDFAGFAILYRSRLGFGLLEYMAVRDELRGQGLGASLFKSTEEFCRIPIMLEVEAPPDSGGDSIEARRIQFYRRLGCETVSKLSYRMPQVSSTLPPPMRLMANRMGQATLTMPLLRKWMIDWFKNVYGRSDPSEAIDAMLKPAKAEISFGE